MQRTIFRANTDQINRAKILIPASALAESIERAFNEADAATGFEGFPTYMSHDWTRPIGWNIPLGLHLAVGVASQIGEMWFPETAAETAACQEAHSAYVERLRVEKAERYAVNLLERTGTAGASASVVYVSGAAALCRPGLARSLYPLLFEEGTDTVDKDGLVDYRYLRSLYSEVQPGIFHDADRDLVLFAHSYLRRSLSRLNVLNVDVLARLAALAENEPSLKLRLRLDPDIVGHPDARTAIELEFWRGPKFTDDIATIPAGVTEHKASGHLKEFEGIGGTQFWWKAEDEHKRTFEAEEIRDTPSLGVSNDYYGCRYVHAEFSTSQHTIIHFDGAIRGYDTENFVTRIDQSIDRAGKRSDYTKLFRVDGALNVDLWKGLVVDYFRGNTLIPEYFGSLSDSKESKSVAQNTTPISTPPRQMMIGYFDRNALNVTDDTTIRSFDSLAFEETTIEAYEALPSRVAQAFSRFSEFTNGAQIEYGDRKANLPVLVFGQEHAAVQELSSWCHKLARALSSEREHLDSAAVAFMWPRERYWVVLSICGEIPSLVEALSELPETARIREAPSAWMQDLKTKLYGGTRGSNDIIADINDVSWPGLLRLRRNQSSASFRIPAAHPVFELLSKSADGCATSRRTER